MTAPIEPTQPTEPTGATPPAPTTPTTPVLADLAKEREKRQRLESALAESLGVQLSDGGDNDSHYGQLTAKLAPLKQLADMLGGAPAGGTKTDLERLTERLAGHEQELADERMARFRLEVASDRKLSAEQAAWLKGSTKEELAASADELLALFPTAPAGTATPTTPTTPALKTAPKPDPSQGPKAPGAPQRPTSLSQAVTNTLANAKG